MISTNYNFGLSVSDQYQNEITGCQNIAQEQGRDASLYEDQYQSNPNITDPDLVVSTDAAEIQYGISSSFQYDSSKLLQEVPASEVTVNKITYAQYQANVSAYKTKGGNLLQANTDTYMLSMGSRIGGTIISSQGTEVSEQTAQSIQQQVNQALGRTDINWQNVTNENLGLYDLPNDPAKQASIFKQAASTLQTILSIVKQNLSQNATQSGYLDTRA